MGPMKKQFVPPDSHDQAPSEHYVPWTLAVNTNEARASRRALLNSYALPLVSFLLVMFVTLGALYVPIPPNPDGEQLGYIGFVAYKGGVIYRDAGDINMPGEPLLHFSAFSLFGNHYWSYRLLDYLLMLAFVGAMGFLLIEIHGILAGLLFSLIYPIVYVTAGFWMSGQRDYVAAHAVTLAAFLFLRHLERISPRWLIPSGVLIGVAVLLKPTFGLMFPLLLAYDLYRVRRFRPLVVDTVALSLGCAAVIGPLVALGAVTGALRPFYEITVLFSMNNYAADTDLRLVTDRLFHFVRIAWQWYIVVALCGAAVWQVSRPRASLTITLLIGVVVAASAVSQKKGFGYHLSGALVVLTLLNVYFLMELLRYGLLIPDRRARLLLMILPLMLFGLGLASKSTGVFRYPLLWATGAISEREFLSAYDFDDVVEVARHVALKTKPDQTVWPFTRHLMICTMADRLMPTRFTSCFFLRASKPSPLASAWKDEMRRAMERHPPELIVLERAPGSPQTYLEIGNVAEFEPLMPVLDAFKTRYHHETDIGRFALFRLGTEKVSGTVLLRKTD